MQTALFSIRVQAAESSSFDNNPCTTRLKIFNIKLKKKKYLKTLKINCARDSATNCDKTFYIKNQLVFVLMTLNIFRQVDWTKG